MSSFRRSPLLKLLLSAILLIAVGLAVRSIYLPQKAIADVKRLGGRIQTTQGEPEWLRRVVGHRFRACFERATVVNLCGTGMTDAELEVLGRLRGVERLNLARTQVTDAGLRKIGRMTGLKALDLSWTDVTDEGLSHLATLRRLEYLYLEGTSGPPQMEELQNLRTRAGDDTGVTEAAVKELKRRLPSLIELRR